MKQNKEFDAGYQSGKEDWSAVVFFLMLIIIGVASWLIFSGPTADLINTKSLGEKLCDTKGYDFDHREISTGDDGRMPIIYCKERIRKNVTGLVDGIVLIEK